MSYGFKVTDMQGKILVKQGTYSSRDDAMSAGILYINDNDIWDCRIDVEVSDE